MSLPHKSLWASAFMDQARLDLELAKALRALVASESERTSLGSKPELYCPAIYAYCQQALEKAIKAWLWHSRNAIPMHHNPMSWVLRSKDMKKRNRPAFLKMIDDNTKPLDSILNMAPGAGCTKDAPKEELLTQPNTEYPYAVSNRVVVPCEGIGLADVVAAIRLTEPLVEGIRKYLEVQNLAPTRL